MEYTIERRTGERYTITVSPGQLVELRPDESLVIPEPPTLTASLTLEVLERLEQRIAEVERRVDNLITTQGRMWTTDLGHDR